MLIVAPRAVCYNTWPEQIREWRDFNAFTWTILHGKHKEANLQKDVDLYLINPQGLKWLLNAEKIKLKRNRIRMDIDWQRWHALQFDTLVVDELSHFKSTNTDRFKMFKQILSTFAIRWGLTGSPAAKNLTDLFGQCFILDEGRTLGKYITHYRKQYFDLGYNGWDWKIKPGAEEKIYERISPLVLRGGEELIDLPKVVKNQICLSLPEKNVTEYKELERNLCLELSRGSVTAASAGVATMVCRQYASGSLYLDKEVIPLEKLPSKERKVVHVHTEKLDALENLIAELQGSPLLIGYYFQAEIEQFKKRFGKDVPFIGGGVSPKRSKHLQEAWNAGDLPFLFGHPQAMGHGLNLQGSNCHHVCWYTLPWGYEYYDQFNRRVIRPGNEAPRVFIHHLMMKDTLDERVYEALQNKQHTQQALFKALKELSKQHEKISHKKSRRRRPSPHRVACTP